MTIDPIFLDTLVKVLLVTYYVVIIIAVGRNVKKFKQNAGTWRDENVVSSIAMIIALGFCAWFFVAKLDLTNLPETRQWFIMIPLVLMVVPPGLLLVSGVTTAIQKARKISKVHRYGTEQAEAAEGAGAAQKQLNFSRKIFHGIIFASIVAVLFVAAPFASYYGSTYFWGDSTGAALQDYLSGTHPYSVAQGIIIVIFFGFSWGTLATDSTRISDTLQFPFQKSIQLRLRVKELDSYASYVYFFVGFLFAALFLPPMLLLGCFALFTFGDTIASSVGMRYGKHKIPFNMPKSWEGTLGGFVASFLAGILFVGLMWGLAGAVLFVIIDILTPKLVPISDNILVPMAIPALYWALVLAGIPATCYLLPLLA